MSMELQSQFVIIDGPTLKSVGSRDDRRRLRSQLISRALREQQLQRSQSAQLGNSKHRCICATAGDSEVLARARGRKLLPAIPTVAQHTTLCPVCHHKVIKPTQKEIDLAPLVISSRLVPGRSDPFGTWNPPATFNLDNHFPELIDYCINILWPGFRSLENYPVQFYHTLIPQAASNPHVHHALLLCASTHSSFMRGNLPHLQPEQLHHRGKALQSIRRVIMAPRKDDTTEALLIAMLFLAMNSDAGLTAQYDPSPFMSPLEDMQWLSHYSRSPLHEFHWSAIQIIVEKYGGIQSLTTFALPWLLSWASLVDASITSSKPVYPLYDPNGQPYLHSSPMHLLEQDDPQRELTTGYGFYYLQSFGIREDIVQVFIDLSEVSQVIQLLKVGGDKSLDIDKVGDCRNLIQYRLLTLPTTDDLEELMMEQQNTTSSLILHLYDACRMTALLYSTHVTFPIPRTATKREEILTSLREKISQIQLEIGADSGSLELLLWCTVIGGIAAECSPQRHWYVAQVSELSTFCGVRSWSQLVEIMNHFAWMDVACKRGGRALWEVVCSISN